MRCKVCETVQCPAGHCLDKQGGLAPGGLKPLSTLKGLSPPFRAFPLTFRLGPGLGLGLGLG
eukprot:1158990-Pelagomonas_calceolata.AAC.9